MSRLFIELYMDEDFDVLVAELLRAREFDATTAREAGQLGRSDEAQLLFATDDQRTVETITGATSRPWPLNTRGMPVTMPAS